jgi:hypothetical protein
MAIAAALIAGISGCDGGSASRPGPADSPATPVAPPDPSTEARLFEVEDGFTVLSLGDFEAYSKDPGGDSPWSGEGGLIACAGKPRGYIHTRKSFRDFTLRLDYRFAPPAGERDERRLAASNTGVLVYITGEHKLWPVSLEVQGKHVEMASIKANGGAATVEIDDDPAAREQARKPVGEWNSLEIVSRDGALTSYLNGTKICSSRPGELKEGAIGLQAEDFAVEFRNVRVREE